MKTADDFAVSDRKIFTSPGANFYSYTIYNLLLDRYIQRQIEFPMSIFLELSNYWKKPNYWYLTITNMRLLDNIRVHIHI